MRYIHIGTNVVSGVGVLYGSTSGSGWTKSKRWLHVILENFKCMHFAGIWERKMRRGLIRLVGHNLNISCWFLPARRYASAGNSDCNVSVCLSVCPSITRRYCVKTKKASSTISSPSGSPKTPVFWRQISSPNSKGFPPNGGLKEG